MPDAPAGLPKLFRELCAVCGEPTKMRCSACYQAGTPLFFCLQEHQKLVWPSHRFVCGTNSRPFLYPPLSADEVDPSDGKKPQGRDDRLLPTVTGPQNLEKENKQAWLVRTRMEVYFMRKCLQGKDSLPFTELTEWHHACRLEGATMAAFPEITATNRLELLSRFRHHALVLVVLLKRKLTSPKSTPDDWVKRAFELLLGTVNDAVSLTEPHQVHQTRQFSEAIAALVGTVVPIDHEGGFLVGVPGSFEVTAW
ncbi:hypothetical protein JCM10449v2_005218 [Rhodotorula kratochvilovae]